MFPSVALLLAFAIASSSVHGHSSMVRPQGITTSTCRLGEVNSCDGPCDLRALSYAGANYYPPSELWPDWSTPNPRTAATYQRGQEVSIASTRNNHAPGGFVRLTLVPLDKMTSKEEHAKYAFHYACWGAGVTVATEEEKEKDAKGYDMVQADGDQHDLPKAYYTNLVTIPTHVPDGKYILGWIWYGGLGSNPDNLRNDASSPPGTRGYMGLYWSCSWVEIKGGPMTESYTPVFVNDLSQFSEDGCPASVNTVQGCIYEPCGLDIDAKFMKPAEFENGPPPALRSSMYGATGATAPDSTPELTPEITMPPVTDAPVTDAPVTDAQVTDAPVTDAPVTQMPTDPSKTSQCGGACDSYGYVCSDGLTCSNKVCSCGGGDVCANQVCVPATPEMDPEATSTPEPKSEEDANGDDGESNGLYLQVYSAGLKYPDRQMGPRVTDGMQLCPSDYPSGMTIVCEGVDAAATDTVTFSVNGKQVRVEYLFPYAIASDRDGKFRAWKSSGEKTIRCETNTGLSVSATVRLTCDGWNNYNVYGK